MRTVTIIFLLLLASPTFAELTKEDIRTIFKEENAASEKRLKEYIDLKIETVNAKIDAVDQKLSARIDDANGYFNPFGNLDPFWIAMVMIVSLIILPQLIILYKEIRGRKELQTQQQQMQTQIDQLRKELEALQQ